MHVPNTAICLAALLASIPTVSAHPTEHSLEARTVWAPKVTVPDAQTVWKAGAQETIRWDTSNAPADPTSTTAVIYLGYFTSDGSGDENLDTEHLLATDVDLSTGDYTITVPSVPHRDTYIVALVGDSGNISPEFTIA
ncbi:hypothetical protein PENSPDRAFT_574160 [Peniophora sp. CONT]|nr:hypothetical protein PENSPDRAFT_574160 [Peniophora sp. CONT]